MHGRDRKQKQYKIFEVFFAIKDLPSNRAYRPNNTSMTTPNRSTVATGPPRETSTRMPLIAGAISPGLSFSTRHHCKLISQPHRMFHASRAVGDEMASKVTLFSVWWVCCAWKWRLHVRVWVTCVCVCVSVCVHACVCVCVQAQVRTFWWCV